MGIVYATMNYRMARFEARYNYQEEEETWGKD